MESISNLSLVVYDMYFALKSIGKDNEEKINNLTALSDKWQLIDRIAQNDGYKGIQFSNPFYGILIDKLPEYIKKFRLVYHLDYTADFSQDGEVEKYNDIIEKGLYCAVENRVNDVSLHPPIAWHKDHYRRNEFQAKYSRIIETWLPKFESEGITLSVESHVGGNVFLHNSLEKFADFIVQYPKLGALIDVSHNFNDGRSIPDIIKIINNLTITGLHLSDAISGVEIGKGTHLPVGNGEINFFDFLKHFEHCDIYGALEIRATSEIISESLLRFKACFSFGL
jgi:sugar phosphate isomerase/epimerase